MKKLLLGILILSCLVATLTVKAQNQSSWTNISVENTERLIPVKKQKDFKLKVDEITSFLKQSKESQLSIPYPDGKFKSFNLKESQIMEPALAAKFPNIKAYVGRNPETGDNIRISIGQDGLHAMVFSKEGVFFIDPISKKDNIKHQVYYKKDLDKELINKNFYEEEPIIADKQRFEEVKRKVESGLVERPSGTELRTYRIAVATTGEYTQFHGGTVEGALSAIVTTMNRVNGIYERDVAVTMVLVNNNDQLIYTDASSDPFTNNSAGSFINEVQTEITNVIGSTNFDIGHGFSTGAGGLAQLGSVCVDSRKASGVTGLSEPIGDPYDVDYVAHEIGHQFGAPHTFNGIVGSCAGGNRSASSAYEPGSGSTIMAYAGICGSDNIQNNSDPYFHAASLDFITIFSQDNDGNTCAEITTTGNSLPIVEAGTGGFTIPINTPFQLNGSATDPDGDGISYTWEQFDLGPAGNPNSPDGNAPLFRSFAPTADSFRIFPRLSDVLNNIQTKGEILPSYQRDLTFRLTARDDQGVAGVDYDDISFSVTDQAGPFIVNEFIGDYAGFSSATVTWEVNKTNVAPVNAEFVDIYVSTDGGLTFTEKVAENTPNDGAQVITLPNVTTSTAKFKVAASNNVFFNISSGLFAITESTEPTFTISIASNSDSYCPSDPLTFIIQSESIFSYNQPINLSINQIAGFSGSLASPTINPGESTTLALSNDNASSGSFVLNLNASSGSISKSSEFPFTITNVPVQPTIISPANGTTDVALKPTISWDDTNIQSMYYVEIATESTFTNIIEADSTAQKIYTIANALEGNTTYFARVNSTNNCGQGEFSTVSFTTAAITCIETASSDLPVTIGAESPNSIESTLDICSGGTVESLEVTNISGTHTYINDLTFILVSPAGTEVVLLSNVCGSEDDFNFSISNDAPNSTFSCPPTGGGNYQPESTLNAFLGESIQGVWTLIVDDGASEDGGELQSWGLSLCAGNFQDLALSSPSNLAASENEDGSIMLEWTDNATNELGYSIERSTGDNLNYVELSTVNMDVVSYQDDTAEPATTYFYRVKGFNDNCESGYSQEAVIETLISKPEAPTNLVITIENDYTAVLSWIDNATNETAYLVERAIGTGAFEQIAELNPEVIRYEEVVELQDYTYRILATNSRGNSGYSNEVSIGADVLNINEELLAKIVMYPNPARDYVVIKNENNIQFNKIVIRNALGQLMQDEFHVLDKQKVEIPLQSLSTGLYLIQIESNRGTIIKRLIVE